jgi:nucleotide-binding universal stress UspA family protein
VRHAFTAVESTEQPVKIEVEILQGSPTQAIIGASRSAAMICVGSVGLKHFNHGRVGSTAAALAASSRCPVAIVRGCDYASSLKPGWVVVEVDASPDHLTALQHGLEEARLRHAPLRVVTTWQSRFTDVHDVRAVADGNRLLRAQLNRRLAGWRRRYPDLDVQAVAVHGNIVNFLAKNAESIQLVVVGAADAVGVGQLAGPTGYAALHNTECSVLICDRRRL